MFSESAKITADETYDFIEAKFGKKEADAFKKKTEKLLKNIANFPYMFKASQFGEDVRLAIISKQTSLLYQIRDNHILLHYFWNNRQDPISL